MPSLPICMESITLPDNVVGVLSPDDQYVEGANWNSHTQWKRYNSNIASFMDLLLRGKG